MSFKKLLLIRLDRIGDLVLTLPVDEEFTRQGTQVQWWIPQGLSFITQNSSPERQAQEVERAFSWRRFHTLFKQVRELHPDAAVVFHAPWWVGLLLWLARVPVRVGQRSQWHSFIFFNRGVRQKRSRVEHHELDYNYLLIEQGLNLQPLPRRSLNLTTTKSAKLPAGSYYVVHPGMGGSALNWPSEHYQSLIRQLALEKPVAITGTATDDAYLQPLKAALKGVANVHWLDGQLSTEELLGLLKNAVAVVAPSTGVVHLAASLGVRTVGLYSPVHVQAAKRWGPRGPQASALSPEVDCPGKMACLGQACHYFACMEKISVEDVLSLVRA